MTSEYNVTFMNAKEALESEELGRKWKEALSKSANLRVALQTPDWVKFRWQCAGNGLIGVVRYGQEIVGLFPLLEGNFPLALAVGGRSLKNVPVKAVTPLGSAFIGTFDAKMYAAVLNAIAQNSHIQALFITELHLQTEFWTFLTDIEKHTNSSWFLYCPRPSSKYFTIRLPNSFEEYNQTLSSNARYDFKRGLSAFKKSGDDVHLLRYENAESVDVFLDEARKIAAESWQKRLLNRPLDENVPRREVLMAMARNGMLRSYLLKSGDTPCAFMVGFQCNGVYNFYEAAYCSRFAKYSPGKTLLYLIFLDLFAHKKPDIFYFGSGEDAYKHRYATDQGEEMDMYVMRNTPENRIKVFLHREFQSMMAFARKVKSRALLQSSDMVVH